MIIILKTFLIWLFIACPVSKATLARQSRNENYVLPNHRIIRPINYHNKVAHVRHNRDGRQLFQENSMKNSLNQEGFAKIATATMLPRLFYDETPRHRMEQHPLVQASPAPRSDKHSASTFARYSGTRPTAYAGYHHNHQQQRATIGQNYQRVASSTTTYTKHHSGRRVCIGQGPNAMFNHRGSRFRFVYNSYTELFSGFSCCPGWTQVTQLSFGCNKPTCPAPCLNGGTCSSPGKCFCPKGFTGIHCQTDVDECVTEKPCDQLCKNLPGSYECYCKLGFYLQEDGQSCRKNDSQNTAFEAHDLENEFENSSTTRTRTSTSSYDTENDVNNADPDQDFEIILKRLTKLEKQIAKGKKKDKETTEMNAKIALAVESISEIKRTIQNTQLMQQEIYDMRSKMKEYELESRKVQQLMTRVSELEKQLKSHCASAFQQMLIR